MDKQRLNEIKERTYTFNEVQELFFYTRKHHRRSKYLTVFFATIWASLLILYMLIVTENMFSFLFGAIFATFVVYLLDQTNDTLKVYFERKKEK